MATISLELNDNFDWNDCNRKYTSIVILLTHLLNVRKTACAARFVYLWSVCGFEKFTLYPRDNLDRSSNFQPEQTSVSPISFSKINNLRRCVFFLGQEQVN